MTVSVQQTKVFYSGNDNTTQWDIPFPFLDKEDLKIYVIDSYGVKTLLTEDFAVDEISRVLTYPLQTNGAAPLASGEQLLIMRKTPLLQQTTFGAQDTLDPTVLENGYDKAMLIAQELTCELERCIKVPEEQSGDEINITTYLEQLTQDIAQVHSSVETAQRSAQSAQAAASNLSSVVNTQAQMQETISGLQSSVETLSSTKADKSLSNLSSAGDIYASQLAMPSTTYDTLTVGASGSTYTAPANGWFACRGYAGSGAHIYLENNSTEFGQTAPTGSSTANTRCFLPVKKGDRVVIGYYGGQLSWVRFYYAEGAKSEAN